MTEQHGAISAAQYDVLMRPIRGARISNRSQGGKTLSYVEAWDIKAHLTRIFGFGNWDSEMLDYHHVTTREYMSTPKKETEQPKPMVEVIYAARVQLTIRDSDGLLLCRHSEGAVGSTSGPDYLLGEHHDNALKTAASDALKRCAINMGSQFGLSLYAKGSRGEVILNTVVTPAGWVKKDPTKEAKEALAHSVGAKDHPSSDDPIGDASERAAASNGEAGEDREAMRDHPDAIAGHPDEHGSH